MQGYIKAVLRGTAQGQNIRNILYYCGDDGAPFNEVNGAFLEQFGVEWAEAYANDWVNGLPSLYTLSDIEVGLVDVHGVAVDLSTQVVPINEAGLQSSDTDGVFVTAICPIRTVAPVDLFDSLRLKRSYVAYGPLSSTFVLPDGSLTAAAATALAPGIAVLQGAVAVGFIVAVPCRIGRTEASETPHFGLVSTVSLQPFASTRKSRKRRPDGT